MDGVLVSAATAAWWARAGRLVADLDHRRNGIRLPAGVLAELVELEGAARDRRLAVAGVSRNMPERFVDVGSFTLTAMDVADLLGCTATNVRALCRRGSLPGVRTAGGWLLDPADVAAYLSRRTA